MTSPEDEVGHSLRIVKSPALCAPRSTRACNHQDQFRCLEFPAIARRVWRKHAVACVPHAAEADSVV